MAPPNMYVNIRTNITGVIVTSTSCSGTCLTFSIPRQPKVRAVDNALARGGREVDAIALRTAPSSALETDVVLDVRIALIPFAPLRWDRVPRTGSPPPVGRSGPGT